MILDVLDVFLIILHALCVILILLEDLGLVEIEATLAELTVALLDVSVRGEEHQDTALDTLVQFEEEAAKVTERLLHVLVFEVKLELAAHEVWIDDGGENLRVFDEVFVDQFDLELSSKLCVEDVHRWQSARSQDDTTWALFWIVSLK